MSREQSKQEKDTDPPIIVTIRERTKEDQPFPDPENDVNPDQFHYHPIELLLTLAVTLWLILYSLWSWFLVLKNFDLFLKNDGAVQIGVFLFSYAFGMMLMIANGKIDNRKSDIVTCTIVVMIFAGIIFRAPLPI